MKYIGVTGTNGKTSTVQFIYQMLTGMGRKAAVCGTLGLCYDGKCFDTGLTTPARGILQFHIANMERAGVEYLVMEVSSHSLVQNRVQGIRFDVGVFTNLTGEHLDYHGDFEGYKNAERKILTKSKNMVINIDDPTGEATGDSTDESGENNNNNSDFVAASGTSYILHPVKVRKDAKKSSSTIGVAAWGSAVQLVERSTLWTKIKFTDADSGATLEGYVRNELLTADKKQVTLVELEAPVAAKINGLGNKDDGSAYTLNVRTTPWNCSQSEEYPNVNVLANIGNEKYQVKDGDEVEKLGTTEDGKWVYIRFVKTVDGAEKTEYGWCSAEFVKVEGETPDTPVDTPDAPPAIDPV